MNKTYKAARKIVIAIFGFTVIGLGLAMLVLPGPGILVIVGGLAILAIEFTWAEHYLNKTKTHYEKAKQKAKSIRSK